VNLRLYYGLFFAIVLWIQFSCAQADLSEQLSTAYCNDDFNRADATSLGSIWNFSPTGDKNPNRSATVASQQASVTEPGGGFTYIACKQKVDQKNFTISAKLTPKNPFSTPKVMSLVARAQSTGNLSDTYICGLEYLTIPAASRLSLYKGVSSNRTDLVISAADQNIINGTTYHIAFSVSGNQLKCSLSSPVVDEVTAVDTSFSSGYVGVFVWSLSPTDAINYTFDDFKTEVKP